MIALRHQPSATTPARPDHLPSHAARDLTAGGTQAQIELDGQIYTLRITRAGKLILTK
jgi:hemin uptake protein HemP